MRRQAPGSSQKTQCRHADPLSGPPEHVEGTPDCAAPICEKVNGFWTKNKPAPTADHALPGELVDLYPPRAQVALAAIIERIETEPRAPAIQA